MAMAQVPARAVWWALGGFLLGYALLGGAGSALGYVLTHKADGAVSELLGELGIWAGMLGAALVVSRRFASGSLQRDFGLRFAPPDLVWGAMAGVAALVIAELVLLVFSGTRFAGSNDQLLTREKGHDLGFVVVTLIVALGAPFFEELFFRGVLRCALAATFGPGGAVWAQALLFGLAHLGEASTPLGNVSVVLALSGVGLVLGYTAKLTGRLAPGMFAHCLFNLYAVVSVI